MASEFMLSWILKVHSLHSPLTNHIRLVSKVSAGAALLAIAIAGSGQNAEAQTLSTNQIISISGGAEYGLKYGESFSVSAAQITQKDNSKFRPFETTVGSGFANVNGQSLGTNTQGADPSVVGNAGQSSLTLTFDRDGFLPIQEDTGETEQVMISGQSVDVPILSNVIGDGSITALAGITPFGGDALSGGVSLTNVPPNIRLNQNTKTGLPGIEFVVFEPTESAGSSVTQNAGSITGTLTGASAISAAVTAQSNIINSLTVFD